MLCLFDVPEKSKKETAKAIRYSISLSNYSKTEIWGSTNYKMPSRKRIFVWFPKSAIIQTKDNCLFLKEWTEKIVLDNIKTDKDFQFFVGKGKTINSSFRNGLEKIEKLNKQINS